MKTGFSVLAGFTAERRFELRDDVQSRIGYQETMVRILSASYPEFGSLSVELVGSRGSVGVRSRVILEDE